MKIIKNLLFVSTVLIATSCKKDSSSNNNFPYYFTATINGAAVKYEANDVDSHYGCGFTQDESSTFPSDYDIYQGTLISDNQQPSKNAIYVQVLKYFDHEPGNDEKSAMIQLGNYPYGYGTVSTSTINGADIEYDDANGVAWLSQFGSQTGSSFTITELVNNPDGTSGKIFTANFTCKLYDGSGASIQVTNAKIRGKVLTP